MTNLSSLRCLARHPCLLETHKKVERMYNQICSNIEKTNDKKKDNKCVTEADTDELVEPTTCCMSGCANCVWIQYAEKLSKTMENSDEDIQKMILDKIEDPNMRAFLSLELRYRKLRP
ncbi:oxidoreductase-like domain-containing protein 1 [Athalia rosae]|uniref:oxidoreductase-like domain-containing protein 1 n=1 Tax=Athalia rosae TaxID=37344 RepID=UPI0020340928|nr:oxidoreductase-like domain-containing protein 1 [Athalia rosae]